MQHPIHDSVRIPDLFVRWLDWILEGYDYEETGEDIWGHGWSRHHDFLGGEPDPVLLCGRAQDEQFLERAKSSYDADLRYSHAIFETIPFIWEGGDYLHYAWLIHAPELAREDHLCVSFSPVDSGGPCWLGGSTREGLENLLVGEERGWAKFRPESRPPMENPLWQTICTTLQLTPDLRRSDIGVAARSKRRAFPIVPSGWRYVPSPDDVGVLAPEKRFALRDPDPNASAEELIEAARRHLKEGKPASALRCAKEVAVDLEVVGLMRDAYDALGRRFHAERADRWIGHHRDKMAR